MAFLYNARFSFKAETTTIPIRATIIAASALSALDLQRGQRSKDLAKLPHLRNRLLDPQLYMASKDPNLEPKAVAHLASYPWFHGHDVPDYDSAEYKNPTTWKAQHENDLINHWTRTTPSDPNEIRRAAHAAVQLQHSLGCSAIILAGPLTGIADQTFERELQWLDAGIQAAHEIDVTAPLYATIALTQAVLHGVNPLQNALIHTISSQIASRKELTGAYIIFEQATQGSYVWTEPDPLLCLLLLTDDLCRGAHKDAILNYFGTFGAVASAVGCSGWATGFNLVQRRFSLLASTEGRARPRYYSRALAGDIGVADDLVHVRDLGLSTTLFSPTPADANLRRALAAGHSPNAVPEWQYGIGNTTASKRHYTELMAQIGEDLHNQARANRIDTVHQWLMNARHSAAQLIDRGFAPGGATDVVHQAVWLDVYEKWRNYAKQ